MTQDELQALIDLLNRVPMTLSERLWASALLARMAAEEMEPESEERERDDE